MPSPHERLHEALQFHLDGRLDEAQAIYLGLLDEPGVDADAAHLLGNVYKSKAEYRTGLLYVNQAIAKIAAPEYLNTRGAILCDMGHNQEAINDLNRVLKLQPQHLEALINLCAAHRNLKNLRKAEQFGQRATQLKPDSGLAWINLAGIALDKGMTQAAIDGYRQSLQHAPDQPLALLNLGKCVRAYGDPAEALPYLERAAALSINSFEAQVQLAQAYVGAGRAEDAVEPLIKALEFGRNVDLKKLAQDTDRLNTFFAVANILKVLSKNQESIAAYQRMVAALPDQLVFWCNLAGVHMDMAEYAKAHECYAKALEIDPNGYLPLQGQAMVFLMQGDIAASIRNFEHIRRYQPYNPNNLGWLIAEKLHGAFWDGANELCDQILALLRADPDNPLNTFIMLSITDQADRQLENARLASRQVEAPFLAVRCRGPIRKSSPGSKIKLGYISHDFRIHPLGFLAAEMFDLHNRAEFEVSAYSYGPDDGSDIRRRIQASAENFVDLQEATFLEMAERIRSDGCEILIDLTGSTRGGRPQVMCLRAAPVQAIWLGFMGTMGSDYYDLIVGDRVTIPPEHYVHYQEKALILPDCLQINDRKRAIPPDNARRADHGVPDEAFVLCSFNQAYKLQPDLFAHWMTILKAVPHAVLWLLEDNVWASQNWREAFAAHGVDPGRLFIAPRMASNEHLVRYALSDLALDTYPVNSGATASDALWAGCPMLTKLGDSMVSRMGASLVTAAGIPELVTHSFDEYVAKAIHYARHPEELRALRQRVVAGRGKSALFDSPRLIRNLEKGLRQVAAGLRAGAPLDHVVVG